MDVPCLCTFKKSRLPLSWIFVIVDSYVNHPAKKKHSFNDKIPPRSHKSYTLLLQILFSGGFFRPSKPAQIIHVSQGFNGALCGQLSMIGTASIQSIFKPWDSEPSRVSILSECGQRSQEIAEEEPQPWRKKSQSGNVSLVTSAETPHKEEIVANMYAYKQFISAYKNHVRFFWISRICLSVK